MLAAAIASICSCAALFLAVAAPMFRATEKAMSAMEAASLATEKASIEMEKLMLQTQQELPLTLSSVELAAVQARRSCTAFLAPSARHSLQDEQIIASVDADCPLKSPNLRLFYQIWCEPEQPLFGF